MPRSRFYRSYPRNRSGPMRRRLLTSRWLFRRRFRMAKAMRRRGGKPEMKFLWLNQGPVDCDAGTVTFNTITPANVLKGPDAFQRIGSRIKYMRVSVNVHIMIDPSATASTFLQYVRLMFLVPRCDTATMVTYLNNTNYETQYLDPNVVGILHDRTYIISNPVPNALGAVGVVSGNRAGVNIDKHFKFPRTVTFRQGSDDVIDPKDHIYIVLYNQNGNVLTGADVVLQWRSKVSFVDF